MRNKLIDTIQTIKDRYGVKYASQNKEVSSRISSTLKGKISNRDKKVDIRWEKIQAYCEAEQLEPLFDKQYLHNNLIKDIRVKFKCLKCETVNDVSIDNGYLPTCNKCSRLHDVVMLGQQQQQWRAREQVASLHCKPPANARGIECGRISLMTASG